MASHAYKIPYLEGKVCYLDDMGKSPTVECYTRNIAFKLNSPEISGLKIGDWVRFRGTIYVNTAMHKGQMKGVRPYYHNPADGSEKEYWLFFFLEDVQHKRIGPLDVIMELTSCMNMCRRFIESWEANDNESALRVLIGVLDDTADAVRPLLKQKIIDAEEKRARVKTVDPQLFKGL